MGEFKQFFEIADLSSRSANVNFTKNQIDNGLLSYDTYEYNFKIGNESFSLDISHWMESLVKSENRVVQALRDLGATDDKLRFYFKNVYNISFIGPNGYRSTNSNNNPSAVYSQILLGIKSFMTDYDVEGIVFSAYDEPMALVYDRFVKNFTNFEVVDNVYGLYLDREIIEMIVSDYPMMSKMFALNKENYRKDLEYTRDKKRRDRSYVLLSRDMIGKILVFRYNGKYNVGLAFEYDRGLKRVSFYYVNDRGSIDYARTNFSSLSLLSDHPELHNEYEKLRSVLDVNKNNPMVKVPMNYSVYTGPVVRDNEI